MSSPHIILATHEEGGGDATFPGVRGPSQLSGTEVLTVGLGVAGAKRRVFVFKPLHSLTIEPEPPFFIPSAPHGCVLS